MSHQRLLPAALLAALALCACGTDTADTNSANGSDDATTTEPSGQASTDTATPALPQPDTGKPLASYAELESGNQVMFLYVAASKLPPDHAKLANSYSKEYRSTSDSFRRNDLLQAIKPQLDQKIAQAGADPYGWMRVDEANLGAYDFDRKGFPVGEFSDARYRYFNDNYDYKIGWANYGQLAFAPVADEATAREIEAMRSKYGNTPRLKVYFFAQSADLGNERVNALVTRVQITDRSGRVLAEYGPDGSVTTETPQVERSADAASVAADLLGF